jgi:hypothetical protein
MWLPLVLVVLIDSGVILVVARPRVAAGRMYLALAAVASRVSAMFGAVQAGR